ncbi:glutamine-hydrolyzing carbamoyl-phosphate synthase small subunit [Cryobacterium sp. TMT1-21]|uniref:Carbamoyl phosphate synthase small chain n=1 Tax=Cryobacterium shii TaxID=1259235 RepID=A0AAQ2HGX7_9MICO|nr:glutamine-hydrolyzing carbamoyl-phosphate synthase small subunit [Cryobacterium shii]TFC83691.1 glutamine-hydrolyzing carbamoyl-phosphate synthase small subunit [Cryobacterium sp. TmT2-59]TFD13776.1 glutamine-hydrolyzing carbamoyl-phosphate synthase small subunit [Cryobacterium sp. TMT4-10]TFD16089.1 glutamine-hydrolyzing carbamoyl-phosphate synthase small subunit [Cryobacterium sp. TMT1-21]TFD27117.1 glutamine-hydrolyzing carbamoyl-phosphate synthase small subunit [Cryobacterium sp. TMT2-23
MKARRSVSNAATPDRPTAAVLVLEDGRRYEGRAYGSQGQTLGEIVFATGMTGYQETLTDPSYAGQIVLMTAPHIGNTGANDEDMESRRIWVSGFVVREPARIASNFRSTRSLDDDLESGGVVGISGIDTRAITRHIRSAGAMRSGIFSGDRFAISDGEQLELVRSGAAMRGRNLSDEVSTVEPFSVPAQGERIGSVVVLDLGVKTSTLNHLAARGFEVLVLPQSVTAEHVLSLNPSAVFFSNGPGDPAASDAHVTLLQEILRAGVPYFGICFGNQLLGRALGFRTYKLPFGHRGINQPVLDKSTGRVEITSQNHGFAVDMPIEGVHDSRTGFGKVEVSHYSLNDQVVEGIRCLDIPAFSVQYHPESAAGPHDAEYLFDRFREVVVAHRAAAGAGDAK